MRRRTLLGFATAALVAPGSLFAQPAQAVRRIGILSGDAEHSGIGQWRKQHLLEALQRVGYVEGRNLVIEWRWAGGNIERLSAMAAELVRLRVEVIVPSGSNEAAAAAKRATRTIPIVLDAIPAPVETGLIDSHARPGGNVTGTSWSGVEIVEKIFQILKQAVPAATRVAVMRNPTTRDARLYMNSYERAAGGLGMTLQYFFVTRPDEVAGALDKIAASQPDALFFAFNPVFSAHIADIVAFAEKRKLVSVGTVPSFVEQGGLLCYVPDRVAIYPRTASYVDRVLRSAKPADLPVELPSKYELVINAKTARAIGYKFPPALLQSADRVIE